MKHSGSMFTKLRLGSKVTLHFINHMYTSGQCMTAAVLGSTILCSFLKTSPNLKKLMNKNKTRRHLLPKLEKQQEAPDRKAHNLTICLFMDAQPTQ